VPLKIAWRAKGGTRALGCQLLAYRFEKGFRWTALLLSCKADRIECEQSRRCDKHPSRHSRPRESTHTVQWNDDA